MLSAMKVNLDDPQQGVVLSLPSLVRIPGVSITLKEDFQSTYVLEKECTSLDSGDAVKAEKNLRMYVTWKLSISIDQTKRNTDFLLSRASRLNRQGMLLMK